jgi:hypothetical protein
MIPISSYITTDFSKWEDHQRIAQDAKQVGCNSLSVLVSANTRTSYATLKSMNLVIHTTTWWGDHPSMAYYAAVPTEYIYTVDSFEKQMETNDPFHCFISETADTQMKWALRILSKNEKYVLGVR